MDAYSTTHRCRGGLTTHSWGPRAIGDHGARGLAHTQATPKKAYEKKKVAGASHGAPY
ncbi:unnamed protein product [Staurois parvus]|uniref:Uncharacterized protein n=1 Tax=Staurois parvus TaxID=386267 RepID=A0ABN9AGX7_9NEOB|nr:unnamed protein product [Staurois parvus]